MSKPFASTADTAEQPQRLEELADGVLALTTQGDPNVGKLTDKPMEFPNDLIREQIEQVEEEIEQVEEQIEEVEEAIEEVVEDTPTVEQPVEDTAPARGDDLLRDIEADRRTRPVVNRQQGFN